MDFFSFFFWLLLIASLFRGGLSGEKCSVSLSSLKTNVEFDSYFSKQTVRSSISRL